MRLEDAFGTHRKIFPNGLQFVYAGNVGMLGLDMTQNVALPVFSEIVSDFTGGSSLSSGVVFQMR
jgi:hypothetical protein